MINLILKDLFLLKKTVGLIILYSLVMIVAFQNMPGGAFIGNSIGIGYLFMMRAVASDEKNKFELILCSLPIARSKIVLAKYLSMIIYAVLAILSYVLANGLLLLLKAPISISPITGPGTLIMLFTLFLMTSIYLPLYFKLGYMKTYIINLILFLVFFFLPGFLIGYLNNQQRNPLSTPIQSINLFLTNLSNLEASLLVIGSIVVLTGFSILLSICFYRRREF